MIKTEDQLRDMLLTEFDKNYMVEAGAGAGKTTLIISRIINQILIEDKRYKRPLKLDEIAAITFTEKAASELKQKVMKKLYEASEERESGAEKEVLKEAIALIDDQYVGTIHSFCREILIASGFESSIGSDFKVIEPIEDGEIKELVWRKYLVSQQKNLQTLFEKINEQGLDITVAKSAFMTLLNYEHAQIEYDQAVIDKGDGFSEFRVIVDDFLRGLKIDNTGSIYTKYDEDISSIFLKPFTVKIAAVIKSRDMDNYYLLLNELIKDPSGEIFAKKSYLKKNSERFDELFTSFEGKDLKAYYDMRYNYIYNLIIATAYPALKLYEMQKKSIMCVNFDDLLVLTRNVLRDYPSIRKRVRDKYKFLYIDEYQDTDPIQTEILFYLNGEAEDENIPWDKRKLISGSTFIVGDPKQSIYRFRGADITLYNKVKEIFTSDIDSELVVLKRNYRTQSGIVEWVEDRFKLQEELDEMVASENGAKKFLLNAEIVHQANFYGMNAVKKDSSVEEEHLLKGVYGFKASDAKYIEQNVIDESLWIAKFIEKTVNEDYRIESFDLQKGETIQRPLSYNDFLIILYRTKYMGNYIKDIKDRNIPVSFAGKMRIGDIVEIANFIDLIYFLSNPLNESVLAAVLTNSYGINNLEDYTKRFIDNSLQKVKLYDYLSMELDEYDKDFRDAINSLKIYLDLKHKFSPIAFIRIIMDEVLPIFTQGYNQTTVKSIAGTLFSIIEKLSNKNIISFEIAANELMLLKELDTEKEMLLEYSGEDDSGYVRIMNLHKAKGLEAPVVILATSSTNMPLDIDNFSKQGPKGKEVFLKLKNGYQVVGFPSGWDAMEQEARIQDNAENLRLQYVATTRAENVLLISEYEKNHWMNYFKENLPKSLNQDFFEEESERVPLKSICYKTAKNIIEGFALSNEETIIECSKNTYSYTTPSSHDDSGFSKSEDVFFEENHEISRFKGVEWGSIVHRLFEIYLKKAGGNSFDRGIAIDSIIDVLLEFSIEEEIEDYNLRLISILANFINNTKFKELSESAEILTETIFDRVIGRDYISGIIDLLFVTDDGFYIIDYKTNAKWGSEEGFIDNLILLYKDQLNYYKEIVLGIMDKKVLGVYIYSTAIDKFIEI
ncbi:MAG: UvrD-helicase domain-containing protein [Gudongella sp.]|nr:UvrD-helicase domain-containing protein [Gudongella sp.]